MVEIKKKIKTEKVRCGVCRKRISLTYIECKCGGKYCAKHRYANEHNCEYDHKKYNNELIRKNNPIIIKEKFEKIN